MADGVASVHPEVNPWLVAVSVMFGTFMEVLDTTVVNVSLPHIAGSLAATPEETTWALTSYLVANAIVLPLTGWLATVFGRKRLFMTAVGGFTIASFLCGLAPNLAALIIFRIIQGATGGVMQPLSQAVMLEAFPPEGRAKAMAFWGLGIVVAPMLGPVIGGWLTDNYSWRWVFYINIPVGALCLVLVQAFLYDPSYLKRTIRRIDVFGILLLVVGMGSLQIVLDKGQQEDWFESSFILWLTVACAASLVWLVYHELTTEHPVVDLRVFKLRTFSTGVVLMTLVGFVLYGSLVLLPLLLQQLLGYPALQAGIALAPRGLGSFLFMPIVGVLLSRFDARKMLATGMALAAWTLWELSLLNLDAGYWDIFWPQLIQGVALSLLFVPLTTVTMNPIPKERTGNATSLFNLLRNIGGSMGIATATTLVARRQQFVINRLGANVSPYNPQAASLFEQIRRGMMARGSDAATATRQAQGAIFGMVQQQAAMLSFLYVFQLLAILFVVAIPLLLLMKRPRASGPVAMH